MSSRGVLYDVFAAQAEALAGSIPDDLPEHRFSLGYRRRERAVLKAYERSRKNRTVFAYSPPRSRTKLKYLVIAIIFACLLAVTGFAFMYISDGFKGKVYHDNTWLFPTDNENCPEKLEKIYTLPYVPDGFELKDTDASDYYHYFFYNNEITGQIITIKQFVKSVFNVHVNTEKYELVETKVNGHNAVYIDFSTKFNSADIIWDNGDYIFMLRTDFSLEETMKMAEDIDTMN